jgi:hypothetical protein
MNKRMSSIYTVISDRLEGILVPAIYGSETRTFGPRVRGTRVPARSLAGEQADDPRLASLRHHEDGFWRFDIWVTSSPAYR